MGHGINADMNPVRISALVLLAAGVLMLGLDIMQRLLSAGWNGMALGYLWATIAPAGLLATERFVETHISVTLWQQLLLPALMLPAWVALLVTGIVVFIASRRFED